MKKFDPDSDEYDSSKKQRVPSWCDRILFTGVRKEIVEQTSYNTFPSARHSDHRPVFGIFRVKLTWWLNAAYAYLYPQKQQLRLLQSRFFLFCSQPKLKLEFNLHYDYFTEIPAVLAYLDGTFAKNGRIRDGIATSPIAFFEYIRIQELGGCYVWWVSILFCDLQLSNSKNSSVLYYWDNL